MKKAQINEFFVQYLPKYGKGRKVSIPLWRIVMAILYKLKTGVQWRYLPMREFFGFTRFSWQSVYYHYIKWCKTGAWTECSNRVLKAQRGCLDLSTINLDGSHSPAKKGGQEVGYQGRKKCKTTNILIITDNQGIPISWSEPIRGKHNDSFELPKIASCLFADMEHRKLSCEGLFLNADAGFDTQVFRSVCYSKGVTPNIDKNKRRGVKEKNDDIYAFDNELYSRTIVRERKGCTY